MVEESVRLCKQPFPIYFLPRPLQLHILLPSFTKSSVLGCINSDQISETGKVFRCNGKVHVATCQQFEITARVCRALTSSPDNENINSLRVCYMHVIPPQFIGFLAHFSFISLELLSCTVVLSGFISPSVTFHLNLKEERQCKLFFCKYNLSQLIAVKNCGFQSMLIVCLACCWLY